jgi:hypothetical protein
LTKSERHLSSDERNEFIGAAVVARVNLKGASRNDFVFVFEVHGYCGSAGCASLIGERRPDGHCHLLSEGDGAGDVVEVLNRRDHGYRRLYMPCEFRFDGKQYQQVREECPTLDIRR